MCVGMLVWASGYAQHTTSGYFLDGYLTRYQMNPAMGNSQ